MEIDAELGRKVDCSRTQQVCKGGRRGGQWADRGASPSPSCPLQASARQAPRAVGADKQPIHHGSGQTGTDSRLFLSAREVGALPGARRDWPFCTAGLGAETSEAGNPGAATSATRSQANAPLLGDSVSTVCQAWNPLHSWPLTASGHPGEADTVTSPLTGAKGRHEEGTVSWGSGPSPLLLGHRTAGGGIRTQVLNCRHRHHPILTALSLFPPFLPTSFPVCSPPSLLPSILLVFFHIY